MTSSGQRAGRRVLGNTSSSSSDRHCELGKRREDELREGFQSRSHAFVVGDDYYDPAFQSYSLRGRDWRYIRYSNGKEELYHCAKDAHEWTNLALDPAHTETLAAYRAKLLNRIPESIPRPKESAEVWKAKFFKKHPKADSNGDGKLTWPEFKAYKTKLDAEKAG